MTDEISSLLTMVKWNSRKADEFFKYKEEKSGPLGPGRNSWVRFKWWSVTSKTRGEDIGLFRPNKLHSKFFANFNVLQVVRFRIQKTYQP